MEWWQAISNSMMVALQATNDALYVMWNCCSLFFHSSGLRFTKILVPLCSRVAHWIDINDVLLQSVWDTVFLHTLYFGTCDHGVDGDDDHNDDNDDDHDHDSWFMIKMMLLIVMMNRNAGFCCCWWWCCWWWWWWWLIVMVHDDWIRWCWWWWWWWIMMVITHEYNAFDGEDHVSNHFIYDEYTTCKTNKQPKTYCIGLLQSFKHMFRICLWYLQLSIYMYLR